MAMNHATSNIKSFAHACMRRSFFSFDVIGRSPWPRKTEGFSREARRMPPENQGFPGFSYTWTDWYSLTSFDQTRAFFTQFLVVKYRTTRERFRGYFWGWIGCMGKWCEYNLEWKRSRTMGDETQCPASWLFGMNGSVFLFFAFGFVWKHHFKFTRR